METQRRFKEQHHLPYPLLSDPGGKVSRLYSGLIPVVGRANRATFVVDRDGRVTDIVTGSAAIDPSGSIAACPSHR